MKSLVFLYAPWLHQLGDAALIRGSVRKVIWSSGIAVHWDCIFINVISSSERFNTTAETILSVVTNDQQV